MSVGELFDGTVETAAGLATDRHLVFDWDLIGLAWTAGAIRRRDRGARGRASAPARWPTAVLSNHDQPRHASRLAAIVGADGPATRSRARPRVLAPDPARARRSCTTARSSGCATSTSRPRRASTRRRRRWSARISTGGTVALPNADAVVTAVPAAGSRPAGRGCGLGPTSRHGTSRSQAADPDSVLCVLPPAHRAARGDAGAPGRRISTLGRTSTTTSSRTRARRHGPDRSSWCSTSARTAAAWRLPDAPRWTPAGGARSARRADRRADAALAPAARSTLAHRTRAVILEAVR